MTAKRFGYGAGVNWQEDVIIDYETEKSYNFYEVGKLLNELHEENQSLKFDNKELIRFITSKGYTLQDYIKFIGQFQSVGVNKEDWE